MKKTAPTMGNLDNSGDAAKDAKSTRRPDLGEGRNKLLSPHGCLDCFGASAVENYSLSAGRSN